MICLDLAVGFDQSRVEITGKHLHLAVAGRRTEILFAVRGNNADDFHGAGSSWSNRVNVCRRPALGQTHEA